MDEAPCKQERGEKCAYCVKISELFRICVQVKTTFMGA